MGVYRCCKESVDEKECLEIEKSGRMVQGVTGGHTHPERLPARRVDGIQRICLRK